jgi:hypothetical protein
MRYYLIDSAKAIALPAKGDERTLSIGTIRSLVQHQARLDVAPASSLWGE